MQVGTEITLLKLLKYIQYKNNKDWVYKYWCPSCVQLLRTQLLNPKFSIFCSLF